MPSPTSYRTPVTSFSPASVSFGHDVADRERWGGGLGTGVTLSFSFPGNGSVGNYAYFSNPYPAGGSGYGEWDGRSRLGGAEMAAVRAALHVWDNYGNLTFSSLADQEFAVT